MSVVKILKCYEKEIANYERCKRKIAFESDNVNLAIIRKKLLIKAKIAYYEGKFFSMLEARKSVPSIKQLKAYMESTNATECEHNKVLWATSEEIQEYLA